MGCSKIKELNDNFRRSFTGGQVMLTQGIMKYPKAIISELLSQVRNFDNFNEGNNPYGENDFGAIDNHHIGKIFWKIDYYNPDLTLGSENPADESITARVLTIMLADEY